MSIVTGLAIIRGMSTLSNAFCKAMKHTLGKRFHTGMEKRVLHSYDAMNRYCLPDAVAEPANEAEVVQVVTHCREHRVPIVPRGAGCGFSGGSLPIEGGLLIQMGRMNDIRVDAENLVAEVGPGAITEEIHRAAESVGLFYPPDPASFRISTIGGNIAENAGGPRAVKYGVTGDFVMGLRVVLMSGEALTFGSPLRKDVAGYDLTPLFVGSEGTLGILTKAWLKLIPKPESNRSAMVQFPTAQDAATCISRIIAAGLNPSKLEIMDDSCITALTGAGHDLPTGCGAILLVEVDGAAKTIGDQLERVRQTAADCRSIAFQQADSPAADESIWELRRALSPIINTFGDTKVNEDVVVPRSLIPELFTRVAAIREEHELTIVCFGHAGDGNIHVNLMFNKDEPGIQERVERALDQLFTAVIAMGGSISGEHGIGIAKQPFLHHQFSPEQLAWMKQIKRLFDPLNLLNPGKIFDWGSEP